MAYPAIPETISFNDLQRTLLERYQIRVSRYTLQSRLRQWGVPTNELRTEITPLIEERLSEAFFAYGLDDQQLVRELTNQGFRISLYACQQIRLQLGIYRRHTPTQIMSRLVQLRTYFGQERLHENVVCRLGRTHLQVHLRQRQFTIPRDPLFKVFHEFHPSDIDERRQALLKRRHGWTTPGPNFTWSIDGYCKLAPYGIEVYAAIDAHSRYIPWFYVGTSARCGRSILAQYLNIVNAWDYVPLKLRSDRGTETILIAMAHWFLSRDTGGRRYRAEVEANIDESPQLTEVEYRTRGDTTGQRTATTNYVPFSETWAFGKSTSNQRIESWWRQLCDSSAWFWREYFAQLAADGLWTKEALADRIALIYIFLPVIQLEFESFVHTWNGHKIRKQSNRDHVVSGVPYMLFCLPDPDKFVDCRVRLDRNRWQLLMDKFGQDQTGLDEYLPETTMLVCKRYMIDYDKQPRTQVSDRHHPYLQEYTALRLKLSMHIRNRLLPPISLLPKPTSDLDEIKRLLINDGIRSRDIDNVTQGE